MAKGINFKGLCIVPEGKFTKSCKIYGYPYEVSSIANLENIIDYASRHRLGVLYLSCKHGLVYFDDIISKTDVQLYKLNSDSLLYWSNIVSEEVYRECISRGVHCVHFMCRSKYVYSQLIDSMERKGIHVLTPIVGCSSKVAKERLRF